MGEVPVKNKYAVDGDIVAFEQLIQSLLFFDNVCFIDDYKEEYSASRKKYFNFLRPVVIGDKLQQATLDAARAVTNDVCLKVEAGDIKDKDFTRFFELLGVHSKFTWDMSSSHFYLVMKMLKGRGDGSEELEKHTRIMQMIFSELGDKKNSKLEDERLKKARYLSKDGKDVSKPFKQGHRNFEISSQVKAFAASLSWLSLRTAYYTVFCSETASTPILHPIRQAFHADLVCKGFQSSQYNLKGLIDYLAQGASGTIKNIKKASEPWIVDLNIPCFSAWLTTKTDNPKDYLEIVNELKEKKKFVAIRKRLNEIEELNEDRTYSKFVIEANKLRRDLDSEVADLLEHYSVKTRQGIPLAPIIKLFAGMWTDFQIPNLGLKLPIPDGVSKKLDAAKEQLPSKAHRSVFRCLVKDLVTVERLGELHQKISSAVKVDLEAKDSGLWDARSKTEESKFAGRESHWKKPM